jgi:hypothetical protein
MSLAAPEPGDQARNDETGSSGDVTRWMIRFTDVEPDASDFSAALGAFDAAISAGPWADAALAGGDSMIYQKLSNQSERSNASSRFFPGFGSDPFRAALQFMQAMDPLDSLDVGVLAGLNLWLRDALRSDPALYQSTLGTALVESVRRQSPVVVVFAVPLAIKLAVGAVGGGGVAAATITGIMKGVDKYFAIQKTRADTTLTKAQTEKTHLESEEIRQRLERSGGKPAFKDEIISALNAEAAASPEAIDSAGEIGARTAVAIVAELDRNPSVRDVAAVPS